MQGPTRLVQAGIATTRGAAPAEVLTHLEAAEQASRDSDMVLHATVAARRRGAVLGGDAGADLIREADTWMDSRNIRNPGGMTALVAPGIYPDACIE